MRISELGFNNLDDFSEQVWRTVARHPYCDVDMLAEWLDRPEPIVEAEINRLVEAGLLRQVGRQWEPQDPVKVLQARHAEQEAALSAARATMADERARLYRSDLFGDYVTGRQRTGTSAGIHLLTRDEIFGQMAELTAQSTTSLRFLQNGPPPPGLGGNVPDLLATAAARGVQITSVWASPALTAAQRRQPTRRLPPMGHIRIAPAVPMRTMIWDTTAALIPVRDDDLDAGGLVTVAPTLIRAVTEMVTRIEQTIPTQRHPAVAEEPAAIRRQRALLLLLDRGLDYTRAARELGVSDRTIKRDVADLCHRLGVTTPFQLGAAAAHAGYLPHRPTTPRRTEPPVTTAVNSDASQGPATPGSPQSPSG
ncbi:helix-turn-helix domain-containing protein [Frankia sp. Mgl5]|uniref:helix-turn-helix domain-containing protein n=1 Tax=Frankia sp. Mgl5 TaxID=2933793 RepID=UPI00200DD670|nr:helix-turn-helix domain-containing protein [Frankia sp. Mgl5]MCK9931386.1 helix-turn-helix domain-containing protein [Frankia sp. Mgl5]